MTPAMLAAAAVGGLVGALAGALGVWLVLRERKRDTAADASANEQRQRAAAVRMRALLDEHQAMPINHDIAIALQHGNYVRAEQLLAGAHTGPPLDALHDLDR